MSLKEVTLDIERQKWKAYLEAALSAKKSPPMRHHIPMDALEAIIFLSDGDAFDFFNLDKDKSGFSVWIQMNGGGPTKGWHFIVSERSPDGYQRLASKTFNGVTVRLSRAQTSSRSYLHYQSGQRR